MAYTSRSSLLAEAKRLAEQAINVSDKVKDNKNEYPEKEYKPIKYASVGIGLSIMVGNMSININP